MFQPKKSLLAVAVVAASLSSTNAFALPGLSLGVMGGASISAPSVTDAALVGSATLKGGTGLSAGATLGAGPLEVSALYSQYQATALSTTVNSSFLDVPVLFRMGLGPISLGLGGFYSMHLSDDSGASQNRGANYGATASVRLTIPVVGFFVDGR